VIKQLKVWTIFVFVSKSKDDNFCTMEETKKKETYRQTCIQTNSSFVKKIYLTRSQAQKWVSEIARKDNI